MNKGNFHDQAQLFSKCEDLLKQVGTLQGGQFEDEGEEEEDTTQNIDLGTFACKDGSDQHSPSPQENEELDEADMESNELFQYIQTMEKELKKSQEDTLKYARENYQLKEKLIEFGTLMQEMKKNTDSKGGELQENMQKLLKNNDLLSSENEKLRGEMKKQLDDKGKLIEKIQVYDQVVEKLKSYNEQLLKVLEEYQAENTKLKDLCGAEAEGSQKQKEEYLKKLKDVEQIQSVYKGLEERLLQAEQINLDLMSQNQMLSEELNKKQASSPKTDHHTTLIESYKAQISQKDVENLELVKIIEQFKELVATPSISHKEVTLPYQPERLSNGPTKANSVRAMKKKSVKRRKVGKIDLLRYIGKLGEKNKKNTASGLRLSAQLASLNGTNNHLAKTVEFLQRLKADKQPKITKPRNVDKEKKKLTREMEEVMEEYETRMKAIRGQYTQLLGN